MKYEFTGTVKNNENVKFLNLINILMIIFILLNILPYISYKTGYLTEIMYFVPLIPLLIILIAWIGTNNYYKDKKEIDENDPYFRGVIVKIRLFDDYIQITKLGRIPWDKVKYIKEKTYSNSTEDNAKAIEIVFEHKTGRKRIYLIETPISNNSKCRYVNTMVDDNTYEEVLIFLSSKSTLLGIFGA